MLALEVNNCFSLYSRESRMGQKLHEIKELQRKWTCRAPPRVLFKYNDVRVRFVTTVEDTLLKRVDVIDLKGLGIMYNSIHWQSSVILTSLYRDRSTNYSCSIYAVDQAAILSPFSNQRNRLGACIITRGNCIGIQKATKMFLTFRLGLYNDDNDDDVEELDNTLKVVCSRVYVLLIRAFLYPRDIAKYANVIPESVSFLARNSPRNRVGFVCHWPTFSTVLPIHNRRKTTHQFLFYPNRPITFNAYAVYDSTYAVYNSTISSRL